MRPYVTGPRPKTITQHGIIRCKCFPLVLRRLCETSPTVTWGNEMTRNRICFLTPSDERDQWSKIDRARRLESRFSTTLNPAPSPLALVFISQLPKKDARGPTVCSLAVHLCQDQTGVSAKERGEERRKSFLYLPNGSFSFPFVLRRECSGLSSGMHNQETHILTSALE